MSPLSAPGLFTLAAFFGALAAAAIWQAIQDLQWGAAWRFWTMLALSIPLGAAACGAVRLGVQNPYANFWNNAGLGPDWECGNAGPRAAQICFRDLPPRLQPEPANPAAAPAN